MAQYPTMFPATAPPPSAYVVRKASSAQRICSANHKGGTTTQLGIRYSLFAGHAQIRLGLRISARGIVQLVSVKEKIKSVL